MPLIRLTISEKLEETKKVSLCKALSSLIANHTGKPEQYVMVFVQDAVFVMAGKSGSAAFADVRGIGGLSAAVNKKLSAGICAELEKSCGIPADRVYANFTNVSADAWGWDAGTFG